MDWLAVEKRAVGTTEIQKLGLVIRIENLRVDTRRSILVQDDVALFISPDDDFPERWNWSFSWDALARRSERESEALSPAWT